MGALLLETIRIDHGQPQLLDLHRARMTRSAEQLGFRAPTLPDLAALLPPHLRQGVIKCRVIYRQAIESISFDPYHKRQIQRVALVHLPKDFDYSHKYLQRTELDAFRLRSGADEVLLVNEVGLITDSTFSNLLFHRSGEQWETPDSPLLHGVMRQYLLEQTPLPLKAVPIVADMVASYDEVAFVNAMLPLEEAIICSIEEVLVDIERQK